MKSICLIALMFIATSNVFTQGIGVWKNYTDMKNVRGIAVSDNNIWTATEGGMFKYDIANEEFETFTKSEGFSSQNVTAIVIDNDDKVWLGSEEGFINVYNPSDNSVKKILDIYSTDKTLKRINNISVDGNEIYVAMDFGLSILNSQSLTFNETILKFGDFLSESKVYNITIGSTIYVATEEGIAVLKSGATNLSAPESWTSYPLSGITVNEVIEFQNSLVAATDEGVYKLNGSTWQPYLYAGEDVLDISVFNNQLFALLPGSLHKTSGSNDEIIYSPASVVLNSMLIQNEQNILVGSESGVKYLSGSSVNQIMPNGPATNSFQSVTVDGDGNLWAGSGDDRNGAGIFKFDGTTWTTYNVESNPEIASNAYHKVYAASNGIVYLSSWGRGFTEYEEGNFTNYNTTNTPLQGISIDPQYLVISDVRIDAAGNTWLLNFWSNNAKPLSVLTTNGEWYHYSFPSPVITNTEECIILAVDRNNTKWFAVQQGERGGTLGLYYYNENSTFGTTSDDAYGYLNESSGLNSNNIRSIVVDKRGEVWIGTSVGINVIANPAQPTSRISEIYPVRFETISTIAVDPINQKWVGTQNGILVLTADGVRVVAEYSTSNSPLPTNTIRSIAFDEKRGIAYIGTDFGLTTLTTSSIQPKEQFDELFIYPNPFLIEDGGNKEITIDGLIKDSNIKILSITGKLIREFASPGGRVAFWDGRDEKGDLVPSGVYIVVAYDAEASNIAKSKVAVIRK